MKYCKYCGKQLADEALFCSGCGKATQAPVQPAYVPERNKTPNIICILGFVFSLLGSLTIIGLILSIIGYNQVKKTTDKTSITLSKAGIIISSVIIGLLVLLYLLLFTLIITRH